MKVIIFEQNGSAEKKTKGIRRHGKGIIIEKIISIHGEFPEIIDVPEEYISTGFEADLVLNFLQHPDLSDYLVELCEKKQIPVVTTGKAGKGYTPFTCCGLGKSDRLGEYGQQFGFPEYHVDVAKGRVVGIEVVRGAPCGATWAAIEGIIGLPVDEALIRIPLQVQQNCYANPAGFDPITGKSPVHYAGDVHFAALRKAIKSAEQEDLSRRKVEKKKNHYQTSSRDN